MNHQITLKSKIVLLLIMGINILLMNQTINRTINIIVNNILLLLEHLLLENQVVKGTFLLIIKNLNQQIIWHFIEEKEK